MSKERAVRRAQRDAERQAAAIKRARTAKRQDQAHARRERVAVPARRLSSRVRRTSVAFGRRSRAQRTVLLGTVLVLVAGLVLAPTWGARIALVGFTVLLFPVAWTLASGRH